MWAQLKTAMHPDAVRLIIVLFLSFLIGLEREEHQSQEKGYSFGGVRTFPLIGILGFGVALISVGQVMPIAIGLAVLASFLVPSYLHKMKGDPCAGITTEVSALGTYVVGVLVQQDQYWTATAMVVVSLFLLELKSGLEGLARRVSAADIVTFTKFLLVAAVILPVVPNQPVSQFRINPLTVWYVVVAVSLISYAGYLLQRALGGRGGFVAGALVGGAYSSTAATVAMARAASTGGAGGSRLAGGVLMASSMALPRWLILVALAAPPLAARLAPWMLGIMVLSCAAGLTLAVRSPEPADAGDRVGPRGNPLELRVAFAFAALFVATLVITKLVSGALGSNGVLGLAAVVGVTDITPFVVGIAGSAATGLALHTAAAAILIAGASNAAAKGFYALGFAGRAAGRAACAWQLGMASLLLAAAWLASAP